jgi:hypothetical protein
LKSNFFLLEKKILYVVLGLVSVFLNSCQTYYFANEEFNNAYRAGNFEFCKTWLEKHKPGKRSKTKFLYEANLGMNSFIQKEKDSSDKDFDQAFLLAEDYQKKAGEGGLSAQKCHGRRKSKLKSRGAWVAAHHYHHQQQPPPLPANSPLRQSPFAPCFTPSAKDTYVPARRPPHKSVPPSPAARVTAASMAFNCRSLITGPRSQSSSAPSFRLRTAYWRSG